MDKTTKGVLLKIIFVAIGISLIVLAIDYFNVLGMIGIDTSRLNIDSVSLIVGNIIVVSLFFATNHIVDSRGLKKEKNKRYPALIMLKNTYIVCRKNINFFDKVENRTQVAKKCDFDTVVSEEPTFVYYRKHPFSYEESILNFSMEVIITPEEYDMYLTIKKQYEEYINHAISLYDSYSVVLLQREPLKDNLEKALQHLLVEVSK